MPNLSFITLLAYDYRFAFQAISSYYHIADEILLGLDQDRLSWNQKPFTLDLDFLRAELQKIDHQNKIRIIQDNFHAHNNPMANDTAQRNALSLHATPRNWIVQIDADEILLNAPIFRPWLLARPNTHSIQARWITVFKSFGNQLLVVAPPNEFTPVATQLRGQYTTARWTHQPLANSPLELLHFSWARTPEELQQKLANWSHAKDFDTEKFFNFWQSITLENYTTAKNFHPLNPIFWQSLRIIDLPDNPFP